MAVERANDLVINEPRPVLARAEADDMARAQPDAGMGGLQALIENPDQRNRLRDNPDLMPLTTRK